MGAAASRLIKLLEQKKTNNDLMEEDGSNKENINPNTKVSNIHDEDIVEEVHRLKQRLSPPSPPYQPLKNLYSHLTTLSCC